MPEIEDSKQAALIAARAIDDKRGSDIVIQDVGDLLKITDWFVIATAANKRRADAIAEEVAERLRDEAGIWPVSREGVEEGRWILLDYGSIVVHIFQPAERELYRLEQLWDEAPTLDAAAAGIEDPVYSERIAALLGRQGQAAGGEGNAAGDEGGGASTGEGGGGDSGADADADADSAAAGSFTVRDVFAEADASAGEAADAPAGDTDAAGAVRPGT